MPANNASFAIVQPGPGEAPAETVSASALDFPGSGGGGGEVLARVPWADGTLNPAASLGVSVAKIVSDLVSKAGEYGAGKISIKTLAKWADEASSSNTAATVSGAINKIITDLTSTSGEYGAGKITIKALAKWADEASSSNTAATVGAAINKIIADLTSISGEYGAGKITIKSLVKWADEAVSSNTASTVGAAINKIIADLTATSGEYGAGKITIKALAKWADEASSSNTAATVGAAINKIIADLTSVSGEYGAGKITIKPLAKWADEASSSNTYATVGLAINKIITDLTSTSGQAGLGKITAPAMNGSPVSVQAQPADAALQSLVSQINSQIILAEQRSEMAAVQSLRMVARNTGKTLKSIASYQTTTQDGIGAVVAVGDGGKILGCSRAGRWVSQTVEPYILNGNTQPVFTESLNAVAACPELNAIFLACGNVGEIQRGISASAPGGVSWSVIRRGVTSPTATPSLHDIVSATQKQGTPLNECGYVIVGDSGNLFTYRSGGLVNVTGGTAAGMTTANYVGVAYGRPSGQPVYVVTSQDGKIMTSTSADANTWNQTGAVPAGNANPRYLYRSVKYSAGVGFVALYVYGSPQSSVGISRSADGVNWSHDSNTATSGIDVSNLCLVAMDRTVAYLSTQPNATFGVDPATPYLLNAILATDVGGAPSVRDHLHLSNLVECWPFGAAVLGGVLYVVGRADNGDGCVLQSAPFRPNSVLLA